MNKVNVNLNLANGLAITIFWSTVFSEVQIVTDESINAYLTRTEHYFRSPLVTLPCNRKKDKDKLCVSYDFSGKVDTSRSYT